MSEQRAKVFLSAQFDPELREIDPTSRDAEKFKSSQIPGVKVWMLSKRFLNLSNGQQMDC
jgi:hypothetical protein